MGKLMRGAVMGGVGQGIEKAGQQILNAFMMKKRLDVQKQVAESQTAKNQSDMKRNDAYTNYLNNHDILKQAMDAHDLVGARLAQAKSRKIGGPGSTSAQLATRYAGPGLEASPEVDATPAGAESLLADGPATPQGVAPLPQGIAQANPMPDRSAMRPPATQGPAMPPQPPPGDPRSLVAPQPQFDRPMYADNDAT